MPKLIFHDSDGVDRAIDLGSEPILIGRAAECQIQTQDALVSRRHARISWDGGYWIEDLGSSNGVYVGADRVQRAPIRPGDEVRCGSLVMKLVPEVSRTRPPSFPPAPTSSLQSTLSPPATPPPPAAPPMRAAHDDDFGALEAERGRRLGAEEAVLDAERRAASAEGRLADAEARNAELSRQLAGSSPQGERNAQLEQTARQAEGYRRQIEQLRAEIRRLRGGSLADDVTNADSAPSGVMVTELTSERDGLRLRVAELEAQAGRAAASGGGEGASLQRRVDQLTAELRRIRGGGAPAAIDDGRVAELEARVAQVERERDAARRDAEGARAAAAAVPAPASDSSQELERMRRMIDQLNAENRRMRQGAGTPATEADPRVPDLEARLARAEQERDAARTSAAAAASSQKAAAAGPSRADPAVVDAVTGADDALADLRGSLRAATDEIGVLGVEAPGDSVTVLRDCLNAAGDQLEMARGKMKEVRTLLGGR